MTGEPGACPSVEVGAVESGLPLARQGVLKPQDSVSARRLIDAGHHSIEGSQASNLHALRRLVVALPVDRFYLYDVARVLHLILQLLLTEVPYGLNLHAVLTDVDQRISIVLLRA